MASRINCSVDNFVFSLAASRRFGLHIPAIYLQAVLEKQPASRRSLSSSRSLDAVLIFDISIFFIQHQSTNNHNFGLSVYFIIIFLINFERSTSIDQFQGIGFMFLGNFSTSIGARKYQNLALKPFDKRINS